MPEPTQWDNSEVKKGSSGDESIPMNGEATELKDQLDSIPCTESEDSMSDE